MAMVIIAMLAIMLCAPTTVNARAPLDELLADDMPYDSQCKQTKTGAWGR